MWTQTQWSSGNWWDESNSHSSPASVATAGFPNLYLHFHCFRCSTFFYFLFFFFFFLTLLESISQQQILTLPSGNYSIPVSRGTSNWRLCCKNVNDHGCHGAIKGWGTWSSFRFYALRVIYLPNVNLIFLIWKNWQEMLSSTINEIPTEYWGNVFKNVGNIQHI